MGSLAGLGLLGLFIGTFLAATILHLLDGLDSQMGLARKVVQGKARNPSETESENRQIWCLAGFDLLGAVRRRRNRHSIGLLQNPAGPHDAASSGRKVPPFLGLEPPYGFCRLSIKKIIGIPINAIVLPTGSGVSQTRERISPPRQMTAPMMQLRGIICFITA